MSMWGFARNVTKSYLTRLNAGSAVRLVSGGWGRGGITGAGRGFRTWATRNPRSALTRATRIGTVAGAGLLAGNVLNPRNNFGPF